MWQTQYQQRLADWHQLRQAAAALELVAQLQLINNWWFHAPIVNRVITWDNTRVWPKPWDLLVHNGYCELARALGIVYTLMLLPQPKYNNIKIIHTGQDNLVLVDSGKYILNWTLGQVLNTNSTSFTVQHSIDSIDLTNFLP